MNDKSIINCSSLIVRTVKAKRKPYLPRETASFRREAEHDTSRRNLGVGERLEEIPEFEGRVDSEYSELQIDGCDTHHLESFNAISKKESKGWNSGSTIFLTTFSNTRN